MNRSILSNLLFTLISLAVIGLPFYQNGIFFDQGHLIVDGVSVACSAVALILWAVWRPRASASVNPVSQKHSGALPNSSLTAASRISLNRYDVALIAYVLLYVFTLLHTPDFTRALVGALDALALIFPYVLFRRTFPNRFGAQIVMLGIAISSMIVNAIGMANAWHELNFPSAFDFTNHQVSSVFQYHNAYGSFVAAVSLMLLTFMSLRDVRSSWLSVFYAGVAALNIAGLLVSDSRGALMFWIVALVLLMIGTKQRFGSHSARGQLLLFLYISAVGLGAGYHFLHKGVLTANASSGWLGIAITLILPMLIVAVIRLWSPRIGNRFFRFITFNRLLPIGIAGFIVFGFLKFHALLHKVQTYHANQLSVSQRFIFWKDGLKIWAQSPLFGLGGNTWHTLYEKFQTYPYYTTRSHSFLIDTLVEVGLLGFIALVFMVWPIFRETVWPYRQPEESRSAPTEQTERSLLLGQPAGPIAVQVPDAGVAAYRGLAVLGFALFLHSIMDWDMSFNYLRLLMTLGMGASVALFASREIAAGNRQSAMAQRWTAAFQHKGVVYTTSGIGAIALLAAAFFGFQLFRANQIVASAQALPLGGTTLNMYQSAHSLAPYDAQILADIASTENTFSNMPGLSASQAQSNAEQALSTYESASRLAPYDANIQGATATLAYHLGKFQTAYKHAKQAYEDAPFYPNDVEIAMNGGAVYAMSVAKSQPANSQLTFKNVLDLYQQYLKRDEVIQHLPSYLPPMNTYKLQAFTYDSLAAASLAVKQPQQAVQLAQKAQAGTDAHSKQLAHLITLMAQHQLGQGVTTQQIAQYVSQHPGVQSSFKLLSNIGG